MNDWTKDDQDRVVGLRHELVADFQRMRRAGRPWAAWFSEKLLDAALWIERQGKRLMRGF